MKLKKITAVIGDMQLESVQHALEAHGVKGFTVFTVRGRGKYSNLYTQDQLVGHTQMEVYTSAEHVDKVAKLIMNAAEIGEISIGFVAITDVEQLLWVHEQRVVNEDDFNYFEKEAER
ncbi:P-II family nitrogen regulator [Shewanella canadensis]|uniref:P-II family nitrogen regulator n=1 Tax=Shewanella canadensis TaxID=271096 RepID=A0A3S0KVP1_9GAMM|nr:P-II family nitrogen regulator [Shewanella canadensis]RTR38704.1 P-II family nitrogen regulator [Shewanella canadensis]